MKIYFDTNVIISAFLTMGSSFEVIIDAVEQHEVYYTDFLIYEIERILAEKFHFSKPSVKEKTDFIRRHFIKGETAKVVISLAKDKNDNTILSDALCNNVDLFITGDKELLEIKQHKSLRIITPAEYWIIVK